MPIAFPFVAPITRAAKLEYGLLSAAVFAAFVGALFGNRYLKKMTMKGIQRIVAAMLVAVAVGLVAGLL